MAVKPDWLSSRKSIVTRMISGTLLLLSATTSNGKSAEPDFSSRLSLTGDWGETRSSWQAKGIDFDIRHTSFYQGLVSGTGPQTFEYGGKLDGFINLDTSSMGLWEGGGFKSHLEYSHGNAPANLGGAIFAVNTALYWPVDMPEELVATSLYLTQAVKDISSFAVGKFNPVDLLAQDKFYGGWGIDRFMNLILVAPPSGLIPVVFMGAMANIRTEFANLTLMVFDPNDRSDDYFPGDLFEDGVTVSLGGSHSTLLAGRQTTYAATALYSTAEGTDYSSLPPGFETTTKEGSYNVSIEFKHNLQESAEHASDSWGLYFKAAIADGNPNYVEYSVIAGIGGKAIFLGRPQDYFGLGAYYYNLSDELQNSLDPNTEFGDESAIEVYYSWAVTPWLHLGPDIQYIRPASGNFKNALVAALRLQIHL